MSVTPGMLASIGSGGSPYSSPYPTYDGSDSFPVEPNNLNQNVSSVPQMGIANLGHFTGNTSGPIPSTPQQASTHVNPVAQTTGYTNFRIPGTSDTYYTQSDRYNNSVYNNENAVQTWANNLSGFGKNLVNASDSGHRWTGFVPKSVQMPSQGQVPTLTGNKSDINAYNQAIINWQRGGR